MTKPGDLPANNWEEKYEKEHKLRQEAEGELTIVKTITIDSSPEMRDAKAKIISKNRITSSWSMKTIDSNNNI